ncbi:MAG: SPASM domain-containing protein [Candidatus Sumerlaeaceae bacterium]|nr:SPASM domain-containing protein [Candidatus Sumerlaeaceae bacterium]
MTNQSSTTRKGFVRAITTSSLRYPLMRSLAHRLFHELGQRIDCLAHWPQIASAVYRGYYRICELAMLSGSSANAHERWHLLNQIENIQRELRHVLLSISDEKNARALNLLLSHIEFQRGLGNGACLPIAWVVDGDVIGDNTPVWWQVQRYLYYAKKLTIDIRTAEQLSRIEPILQLLSDYQLRIRLVVHVDALLHGAVQSLFAIHTPFDGIVLHLGTSRLTDALLAPVQLILDYYSRRVGTQANTPITWQMLLHRENIADVMKLAPLVQQLRPQRIELFLERAYTATAVERSLFFAQRQAMETLESFRVACHSDVNDLRLPWEPSASSSPSSECEKLFSCVHVNSAGFAYPCGASFAVPIENFLTAWDSPQWVQHRNDVSLNHISRDCYPCQVHARRNVWAVEYLLAAYEVDNPSPEYLGAVRAAIDAVSDVATARELNATLRHFEHSRGLQRVASYPHRMYVEVTDECNLRCPMCTQTVLSGPRKRIALETFEKVRPLLRYMDLIHFTGCGETFLHPKLMEMLSAVPHDTCTVRIITNGILLDEATSRRLVELGLQELWVSIDGTDAATFEKIRGSKLFDKVINNVRTLTRIRQELGRSRPRVALNFVAQRSNIEQLPDFVRMAKDLGANAVNVGFLQVYSRELLTESLYFYQELSDKFMAQAQQVARELDIELYIPGFFRSPHFDLPQSARMTREALPPKCVEPYGFVLVHADGSLGPCCVNDTRLGSLSDNDFIALWNGDLYADFRRRVSTPEEDFDCKHCMLEGYKDIHEFEHHAKLFDENYQRANVNYAALEEEIRQVIARMEGNIHAQVS